MIKRHQQAAIPATNLARVILQSEFMIVKQFERIKRDRSQRNYDCGLDQFNSSPQKREHPKRRTTNISLAFFLGMLLAHIVGALAMRALPVLATVHAVVTIGVSLFVVLRGSRAADAICAVAYIAGSEVLWRMTQASVPWEYAKYAVALVAFAALARRGFRGAAYLPLLYFLLLVPSCLITLETLAWDDARQQISFYLAGPLALTACLLLFAGFRARPEVLKRCLLFYLGPAAAVAALALFGIQAAARLNLEALPILPPVAGSGRFRCRRLWDWAV